MPGSLDDMLGGDVASSDAPPPAAPDDDPDAGKDDEFELHAKDFLDDSNDEETRLEALRMAIMSVMSGSGGGP